MPVNKSTGPLKFYNVTFSYTLRNVATGTLSATSEEEARLKILDQVGKQVDDLVVTSVLEIENPNDGIIDHDDLPEGVTSLSAHRPN